MALPGNQPHHPFLRGCLISPTVTLRACECFEVPLLLTGVLVVESALWNFHRVEYLFRQGTSR